MSKNKRIGIFIWVLCLVLSLVLMFCLERGLTPTFWITLAFVCIAFVSTLIFQIQTWKRAETLDEQFLHYPSLVISSIYMIIQIPISIIFAIGSGTIPYKATLIINTTLLVIAWAATLAGLVGNDHIARVNSRQKDHHTELN